MSGSGKSTILNLITGLLKPTSGKVKIEGHNLNKLNIYKYRERIGFVSQESGIISGTLRDNLNLWDNELKVDELEIKNIIDKVGLLSIVRDMPKGIDTFVGDGGVKLSGGQKQKLFARVIKKNQTY